MDISENYQIDLTYAAQMYQGSNQSMLVSTNFHLYCCGEDGDWTAFVDDEHQLDNLIDFTVACHEFAEVPGHMLRCEHQRQGIQCRRHPD